MEAILEARRHLSIARGFLANNARTAGDFCNDRKYVEIGGHIAYSRMFLGFEELWTEKKRASKNVEWYQVALAGTEKKLPLILLQPVGYFSLTRVMTERTVLIQQNLDWGRPKTSRLGAKQINNSHKMKKQSCCSGM